VRPKQAAITHLARLGVVTLLVPIFVILGSSQSHAAALARPSGVVASTFGQSTSLTVTFNNVANASSYTVKVYGGASFATLVKTQTMYQQPAPITGLTQNTAYQVTVTAIGYGTTYTDSLASGKSTTVTTKTPLSTPNTPTVAAVSGSVSSIRVNFDSVTNANTYAVQVYTYPALELVGSAITPFTSGSVASGLNANTDYVVKVTASSSTGSYSSSTSGYSGVVRTNQSPQLPSIISDPQSVRINPGQSATFSVSASAADSGVLSYQWSVSNGSGSYTDVSGANQSSLTLTNVLLGLNGYRYKVVVTNTLNGDTRSTTSNFATLTVEVSSDNNLATLSVTPGTFSPNFLASQTNYSLSISQTVTAVTLNASPSSNRSTMTLNGSLLQPNDSSVVSIDTDSQAQTLTIVVTAENASTKSYQITIKRVVSTSSSTVITPGTVPTPATSPVQATNQILKTPSVSVMPRINVVNGLSATSGGVGTTVVISGTGFDSLLSVKINGVNITPTSSYISSTSITVTIPAGARSGVFVITTIKGSVSTPRFTVI
jgi:hypothetical protein